MPYAIFDYVDAQGRNRFQGWWKQLEKAQLGKLRLRIDWLKQHGDNLLPDILAGTSVPGILKLKVHGNVQLRPLLCKGPHAVHSEYTLLCGATERDGEWAPKDAPNTADACRSVVARDISRRTAHAKIN